MKQHLVRTVFAWCLLVAFVASAFAYRHKGGNSSSNADNTPGQFDYYLLTLSWAPEFCATHESGRTSSECDPNHHYGFVVHGLWPENQNGSYPENCAPAQPVSNDIVRSMLPVMPARGLIQHEWATHGTCSGLSSQDYFAEVEQAYRALKVPAEYQHPAKALQSAPGDMEQRFADANQAPKNAFRVTCSNGEFVALEICLTKDLKYRGCGAGVRECRLPQMTVLPTP